MKILQKARQFLSLNKELFAAVSAGGGNKGKRFWLYAESLGEFRLAMQMAENIKSILAGNKNEPPALFFISFKTYSVLSLAQKTAGPEGGSGDIRYFFHPWPGFAPVLKKYAAAIKPDCFISIQRRVSKKLIKSSPSEPICARPSFKHTFAARRNQGVYDDDIKSMSLVADFDETAAVRQWPITFDKRGHLC